MQCVDRWKKAGLRGTCLGAVGFGKTNIGLFAMRRVVNANPKCKCILVVPSQPVAEQWKKSIIKCGLSGNVYIYTKEIAARDYKKLSCDFLVIDEVHEIATPSKVNIFGIGYKLILCLTATLERLDGNDRVIRKIAPVCDEVSMDECVRNKWTSSFCVYKILVDVDLTEYNSLTQKFKNLFSYFNFEFGVPTTILADANFRKSYVASVAEEKMYSGDYYDMNAAYKDALAEVMSSAKEFISVVNKRKQFIYSHEKKIEVARRIIDARKNGKGITFWNTIEDARRVERGCVYASPNKKNGLTKKKCQIILNEFKKNRCGVINTVKALNTGFDCPDITYGIAGGFDSSKTRRKQSNGRIQRINDLTKDKKAEIFYIILRGTKDEDWAELALKGQPTLTILESDLDDFLSGKEIMFVPSREKQNATRY